MSNIINRRELAKGVYFSSITDSRYKKNFISVCFYQQLSEETATENAIVPYILANRNAVYPTYKLLKNRLSTLYSSRIGTSSGRKYDLNFNGLTAYFLDDVYALSGEKITDEITDMLVDCIFNPVLEDGCFPEKVLNLEKPLLIDDIESVINDKRSYAINNAVKLLCENEPFGVAAEGNAEKAKALTPQDAFRAYKRMLHNTHCEIMCVGCNDFEKVATKFADAFSKVERTDISDYSLTISPIKEQVREYTERLSVNQSKMVLGLKTHSEDTAALVMLQKIYGGTTTSKLFMNVREKMSLCYYCAASYNDVKGLMLVDCGVENENIEKARAEILHQLDEIKNGNITDEELEHARMAVQNSYNSIGDSAQGVAGWYIDHIIKDNIETPAKALEKYLAVSKERIIEAAKSMVLDTVYVLTSLEDDGKEQD